ncbi:MAG: 4-hydroxy-tetrahydrodipicolinate synthase [Capsulimonadales bacterium]|nr:4-hydroxy-tetrahydrodipicolinate synthase [Capsulimonadales bacterium]
MRGSQGRFARVLTAMVTPFNTAGQVDLNRAVDLARWLLAHGSDALVVNGTTGESPTTTPEEKLALVSAISDAVGSERVMAGAGGNFTDEVIELAVRSESAGASALLCAAGYYNKPSQEGLYRHFRAVAESVTCPVYLYNVPGRTIVNIEASTTARLATDVPNIVGTKEASANLVQIGEILRLTPDDFDVYSGDDGTILPLLALGGAGVISVVSHIIGPDIQAVHEAWFDGRQDEAARLFLKTLPITKALFSAPSPAPVKFALSLLGQEVGGLRLPMTELTDSEKDVVAAALRAYDIGA